MKGWILQHDARIAITWLSLVVMRWSYQAWYYAKLPLRVYFIIFQEESLKRDSHELNTCRIISYNNIYVYTFEKPWQPVWERCNLRKGSWPGKMLGEHRFHGNDDCKYGVWENAIREANGTTSHAWFTQWPSPPRRRPSLEAAAERRPPSVTRATPGTHRRWEHSSPPPFRRCPYDPRHQMSPPRAANSLFIIPVNYRTNHPPAPFTSRPASPSHAWASSPPQRRPPISRVAGQ